MEQTRIKNKVGLAKRAHMTKCQGAERTGVILISDLQFDFYNSKLYPTSYIQEQRANYGKKREKQNLFRDSSNSAHRNEGVGKSSGALQSDYLTHFKVGKLILASINK